eukprot:PLAT1005.1.p1 GENE.PLAT1005.1~~PLAT1005.1.p1  ORF type:complete len:297 (+),score=97.35 PLAT1005.1:39-893(+)
MDAGRPYIRSRWRHLSSMAPPGAPSSRLAASRAVADPVAAPVADPAASVADGSRKGSVGEAVSADDGAGYILHKTGRADTLAGLALRYDVEVSDIKRLNSIVGNPNLALYPTIKVPRKEGMEYESASKEAEEAVRRRRLMKRFEELTGADDEEALLALNEVDFDDERISTALRRHDALSRFRAASGLPPKEAAYYLGMQDYDVDAALQLKRADDEWEREARARESGAPSPPAKPADVVAPDVLRRDEQNDARAAAIVELSTRAVEAEESAAAAVIVEGEVVTGL